MSKDNDFSFGNLGENYEKRDFSTDYLDLLDEMNKKSPVQPENEEREIYSSSERTKSTKSFVNNIYADDDNIYSHSDKNLYTGSDELYSNYTDEPQDVFTIPNKKAEYEDIYSDSKDVYMSKKVTPKGSYEEPVYQDIPIKRDVSAAPTNIRRSNMNIDEDEISDYEARRGKRIPEKKKKKKTPFALILLLLLLAGVVGFAGVMFSSATSIVNNFTKGDEIEHIDDVDSLPSSPDVTNILFIGADKEKGGASRSDSIMIVSVNKAVGKVIVTSVLRDTHVEIPGECEAKINSAFAWGESNLLIQTIEENFRIKIDGYAVVNFNMFTELVDGLGGIDIEVTENEADYINNRHNYKNEKKPDEFQSGESVHLNGYQALWYARIRKLDSDFMRTARQRKVIAAIAENVKNELIAGNIFGIISTAKEVAPNIETSLNKTDFTNLLISMISCISKSEMDISKLLVSQQLPFEDTWWYESKWDGSSIAIDLDENRNLLYESIYEPIIEDETSETTEETNE